MAIVEILLGVLSILGCLFGAGFISGTEIVVFFGEFGWLGMVGIIVSSLVFSFVVYKNILPKNKNEEPKKYNFMPYCQVAISGSMFAGIVQVMSSTMNKYFAMIIMLIVLFLALIFGIKFANFTNIITALLVIAILPFVYKDASISSFCLQASKPPVLFVIYAILYAVMNVVACMPVIKSINKHKISVAIICFVLSTCLMIAMFLLVAGRNSDMPIFSIISSSVLKGAYTLLFVLALLSTLWSASTGAKQIFKPFNNFEQSLLTALAVCTVAFVGFSNVVRYLYPIIAVIMLLQIILNKLHKNTKIKRKNTKFVKN